MTTEEAIPPTREALTEALVVSTELLKDFELGRASLSDLALKAMRVARLINDFDMMKALNFEIGGYPSPPSGITPDAWHLAGLAGRQYEQVLVPGAQPKTYAYVESIGAIEASIQAGQAGLSAAIDRDVSISSANPYQTVTAPAGNTVERGFLRTQIATASQRLASRRAFIYAYVLRIHHELRYSGIADDAFSRVRAGVDDKIGQIVPDAIQKFVAVYDNLRSTNPEDWANAAHSCRRVLQQLADALRPAGPDRIVTGQGGKQITIKMGAEQYINRLVAHAEDKATSERFEEIVGSHIEFLGNRLDALFDAAQKGSHGAVTRAEADRLVVYTYLLVGDLLSL